MLTATISETKNHLSELLEQVQSGETLIILDRKRAVARVERVAEPSGNPHIIPPRTQGMLSSILELPIGGERGKPTGALAALLDERENSL